MGTLITIVHGTNGTEVQINSDDWPKYVQSDPDWRIKFQGTSSVLSANGYLPSRKKAGVPGSTDFVGALVGDLAMDTTTGNIFSNIGSVAAPVWYPTHPLRALNSKRYLRTFHGRLANRANAPVDILFVGDSVTRGDRASAIGNRWLDKTVAQLRTAYQPSGVAGGVGYQTSDWDKVATAGPVVVSGSPGQAPYGLGGRGWILNVSTQTLTYTWTGTGLDIVWTNGSSTTATYNLDGGGAVNIVASGTFGPGQRVQIRSLTQASHTIVVHPPASGTFFIEGFVPYNQDESIGIRAWDAGHAGWKVSDHQAANYLPNIDVIQPSLIVIGLGFNDIGSNLPAATFVTNLAALIALLRTHCTTRPSIMLMAYYAVNNVSTFNSETWANFANAIYATAAADGDVGVCDVYTRVNGAGSANLYPAFLNADTVHPADLGHQYIADALYRDLIP